MFALLRQRNFSLFWTAGLVSSIGDWALLIGLSFYLYDLTGSALATGGMVIARTLPGLLFGSFAGVFVDRFDRRKMMIAADLARSAILLLLFTAHSQEDLWLVYLVIFAQAVLTQFFNPAHNALIPRLVADDQLVTANSLDSMSWEVARLVAPPLGGVIMSAFGLGSAVLADSVSYLLSAVLLTAILVPAAVPSPDGVPATLPRPRNAWAEWLEGLRQVGQDRLIRALFLVMGLSIVGEGMINVVGVIFVKDILHGGPVEQGWLTTAQAVGGILGGAALGKVALRVSPVIRIGLGGTGLGLCFLILVVFPWYPLALVLRVGMGLAIMAFYVTLDTWLLQSVADRYRGRIFGALGTTLALTTLAGQILASVLTDPLGVPLIMGILSGMYIAAGVLGWIVLRSNRGHTPEPLVEAKVVSA